MKNHVLGLYHICHKLHLRHQKCTGLNKYFYTIILLPLGTYYNFLLTIVFGAYIPYTAKLGRNISFNHGMHGIFISKNTHISDNCTILQNTTIGSNQPLSDEAPVIGANVFIGANCNIIGNVIIEDNVKIGAGTTIAKGTILKGSTVVGARYKVIIKNEK